MIMIRVSQNIRGREYTRLMLETDSRLMCFTQVSSCCDATLRKAEDGAGYILVMDGNEWPVREFRELDSLVRRHG